MDSIRIICIGSKGSCDSKSFKIRQECESQRRIVEQLHIELAADNHYNNCRGQDSRTKLIKKTKENFREKQDKPALL